ncbi:MAG TPA: TIR domain-containing protein [Ktedonobacteraceae bacterium]
MSANPASSVSLFYCYAHEDEAYRLELKKHLVSFKRQGYLVDWSDRQIAPGANWHHEIALHLSAAHLILLLISPDFIHSDACDEEMRQALALHKKGQARVVPILLRPVVWQEMLLADVQLLPFEGKPISRWENRDEAWQQVAASIGKVISELLTLPLLTPGKPADIPVTPRPTKPLLLEPRNPYKGLQPFTARDEQDFFGRERLIALLLEKVRAICSVKHPERARLLTVFGASGSGKSSVILAGLLPALQRGGLPCSETWIYLGSMTPGACPIEALATILSPHFPQRSLVSLQEDLRAPSKRGLHLLIETLHKEETSTAVLYVDQFEELFTQTLEEAERQQFIDLLLSAITEAQGSLFVLLSLRADFYDRPMRYPALFQLIEATRVAVLPLSYRDLRDIIKKPASLPDVQLQFEDDLVGELLADMPGQSGVLPLLQFTMDRLFERRQGHLLTLSTYQDMGGLRGALIQHAEATYALLPNQEQRELARALFLQLVEPGALDQDPTRRRVVLSKLVASDASKAAILEHIAALFTTARLLTTIEKQGPATFEVSHEALIRSWPRLAEWLREAYDDLYMQRRVREDAALWHKLGKPTSRLYREEQLADARTWQQRTLSSEEEEAFLMASEQQEQQKHLLQRRIRRRKVLMSGLALGAIATAGRILWNVLPPSASSSSTSFPSIQTSTLSGHTEAVNAVQWSPDGQWLATASADHTVRIWNAFTSQSLHTLLGHSSAVNTVQWSPNGQWLATASTDHTACTWDASTGQSLLTFQGHTKAVNTVQWSPNGQCLATASADHTARVWDASTCQSLLILQGHSSAVNTVQWSPHGHRIATASADHTVRTWDAFTGQSLHTLLGHSSAVNTVQWSPNGHCLATASVDRTVRTWNAFTGQSLLILQGHSSAVNAVQWSPNGQWLATASVDRTVRIWDASTGAVLHTLLVDHTEAVNGVRWSPNGQWLVTTSADGTVRTWDASTGASLQTLLGHTNAINAVQWSPNGQWLATASADHTARIWDPISKPVFLCAHHSSAVNAVQWSPNGQWLATASDDSTACIWNASTGASLLTLLVSHTYVNAVQWSPDGHWLTTASADHTIRTWNASTGQSLLILQGHSSTVNALRWSPNGQWLASASADYTVRIWDASTGQSLHTLTGHNSYVNAVQWSPNSHWLATASADHTVRIWDASTGQSLHTLQGHTEAVNAVQWSPNGQWLATASADHTARVWNASTGQSLRSLQGHTDYVNAVQWSPNSQWLTTASADHTARVWNASTGQSLHPLQGHTEAVNAVQWSPNGHWLATASADHTTRIWDASTGQSLHALQGHTDYVNAVQWSPNGHWLATASADHTMRIWVWMGS